LETLSPACLKHLSPIERSKAFKTTRMQPFLQFMVGPLLRYDTVDEAGVWHGAALIVTADSGSIYDPYPTLTYGWDPDVLLKKRATKHPSSPPLSPFDLPPHPADPHSVVNPNPQNDSQANGVQSSGPNTQSLSVVGQEIYVHGNSTGTFTFWRFAVSVPLGPHEMKITYSINKGLELEFHVPGQKQNMRWATYSCNGFSAGVNADDFRGPGYSSGYDPVWLDLLTKHAETPFHVLVGGGDQLYCDGVTREPELQEWLTLPKPGSKRAYELSNEISVAIDRFYFNH
jgi:hypothetical protein